MKTGLIQGLIVAVLISLPLTDARAQQGAYVSVLLARYAAFNKLYTEKKQAGADLAAIEPIRIRGEAAFQKGDLPAVIEAISQGFYLMQGLKWDDVGRFLSSLTLDADRLVLDGSQPLAVSLDRMYSVDESTAFPQGVKVTFQVVPAAGTQLPAGAASQTIIAQDMGVSQANTTAARRLPLLNGVYSVVAIIHSAGKEIGRIQTPVYAISDFTDRLNRLSEMVTAIKASTDSNMRQIAAQISTPEFQITRLAGLTRSYPRPVLNPIASLDHLESILPAMVTGTNSLPSERGEIERAYRAADGQLVPYRLYVPTGYDGSRAWPLVVALHGALGDEQSYFSSLYDPALIKGEAERRGYIIATPTWVGRFSFGAPAEEDVLRVVSEVQSSYKIDPARVYLTGHSLGAVGVWQMAFDHPEIFAALAPVSGSSPVRADALPPLLARIKAVPAFVVHGSKDGIVPPARSREIVDAAKKAGLQVTYIEAAGADHLTVVGPSFPTIMDFFDKHSKQPGQK